MKKILYIVGVGGRTGAMFGYELQGACEVVGVGMEREIEAINAGKIKIQRSGAAPEVFKAAAILPADFGAAIEKNYPDFIWMATRNPVARAVEFYYRNFKGREKMPALILSQNGLSAINDAQFGLNEALGHESDKVRIIRVNLINGVDLNLEGGTSVISYKIPIKLGFGGLAGESSDLREIFIASQIKVQEFQGADVLKMENSKLFTNLIGMAAAVNGMGAGEGLRDKKMFRQEVAMLKEFVLLIKKSGRGFVDDFCGYPIKFLAQMMLWPVWLLLPWRGVLANIVAKGRNRPKDLSEIDYYNGEVVKLGKQFNLPTPVNEEIVRKAKEILRK